MQVHVLDDAETRTNPCAAVLHVRDGKLALGGLDTNTVHRHGAARQCGTQGILSKRVGKCALFVTASVPIHAAQRFHMTVVFVFLAGPQCASSYASGQLQSE